MTFPCIRTIAVVAHGMPLRASASVGRYGVTWNLTIDESGWRRNLRLSRLGFKKWSIHLSEKHRSSVRMDYLTLSRTNLLAHADQNNHILCAVRIGVANHSVRFRDQIQKVPVYRVEGAGFGLESPS